MIMWWNSLNITEQVFAAIAAAGTVVLIIQTVFLLFSVGDGHDFDHDHDVDHDFDHGIDHDHDFDHDHDHDRDSHHDSGLRIFTVRGFVTFFCIFGWSGLAMLRSNINTAVSVIAATVLGILFMILVAVCMAWFYRLQSSGNADINSAVGVSGTVYIPIPSAREGEDKITANVAGRFAEYNAVTDGEALPTGCAVTVVLITGADTLVVIKK